MTQAVLFVALLFLSTSLAQAWGPDGHRIVAIIAEQRLSPQAREKINKLLDGKYSIVDIASCADTIRGNPRGKIFAQASRDKDEVLVADLDLDMIQEVRRVWQFYRDRRPETYGALISTTGRTAAAD